MREKKQINIDIGEQIRQARENSGLTQEQLAERIEVSPQFISDLERGVVGVSLQTLKRICTALYVSSDRILFGSASAELTAAIAEKCKPLSPAQQQLLLEIVDRFVAALSPAPDTTPK